ncbi:SET domain-protein [Podospora aff. communis PSN243]|uniref:SET domain-protein n=1 Tax=Podospora aff. communis PSN243 TaxID=3040156 RepID=A0AAV9GC54_9PEZI|nr:SET domain-protein [Podospora aff. communis PSN243]
MGLFPTSPPRIIAQHLQLDLSIRNYRTPAALSTQKYADLRNEHTFPPFAALPEELDPDLSYYEMSGFREFKHSRHWCFLAEISKVEWLARLRLVVRDKQGALVPVAFYTDDKGEEFKYRARKGSTVMILYPDQHFFLGGTTGIRLEKESFCKIVTAPLNELMALSDRVGRYSTWQAGGRTCHGCDEKKVVDLQKCAGCGMFWYCDKTCQTTGWQSKGHKRDCKLIRENGLRAMFLTDRDRFEHFIDFLLPEPVTASESTAAAVEKLSALSIGTESGGSRAAEQTAVIVKTPYKIQPIASKGKGMVASTWIPRGTRILSEPPLFRVPRDNPDISAVDDIVVSKVSQLSAEQQRVFFDLTNIHGTEHSTAMGIARTNVLPLGSDSRSGGLFPIASRINHSCRHNAQNTWNDNIGRLTIHALRDIKWGEEITICYLPTVGSYRERQNRLRATFKFTCTCELCSLPCVYSRWESDMRLRKLQKLDAQIPGLLWGDRVEEKTALGLVRSMLDLFREEGIQDASIARAYNDAYQLALTCEDECRAKVFAQRAWEARCVAEGADSPTAVKMKKAVDQREHVKVPELDEDAFEKWLWMEGES